VSGLNTVMCGVMSWPTCAKFPGIGPRRCRFTGLCRKIKIWQVETVRRIRPSTKRSNGCRPNPSRKKAGFQSEGLKSGPGGTVSNRHLRDGARAHCRSYATPAFEMMKTEGPRYCTSVPLSTRSRSPRFYRARASTSVTSSGCSLSPIQSSTAVVTIWLIWGSGRWRFSRTRSIRRCSPNSPKSFSGSVTPSL
jgi:hypothetical protein